MIATRRTSTLEAEFGLATAGDVVASDRQLHDDLLSPSPIEIIEIHSLESAPEDAYRTFGTPPPILRL